MFITRKESGDSTRSWSRDRYYVRALDLKTGDELYETYLTWNNQPLQGGIQPWGKKVVFSGFYQTGPDFVNQRTYIAAVVDDGGRLLKPILEGMFPGLGCVDEKNGLLLCSNKQEIVVYQLEDGKEIGRHSVPGLRHALKADGEGNICIANRYDDWPVYVEQGSNRATDVFVQYEVEPWKKKWSATFAPEAGCVGRIAYDGQYLRFTVVRRDLITSNGTSDEKWAAIGLDKHTGRQVELTHPYVPGVRKVEYDGRYYIVSINPDELQVRLSSEIPNVGK